MAIILLLLLSGGLTPFLAGADVFCDNLKVVTATLPKNVSSSPQHFATATVGQVPDVVYALALCRGDILNDSACAKCVAKSFETVWNATPPEVQCYKAAYYYGDCLLVFSGDERILNTRGENGDAPPFERWRQKAQPMPNLRPLSAPTTPPLHKTRRVRKLWAIPIVVVPLAAATFLCFIFYSRRVRNQPKGKVMTLQGSRCAQDLETEEQLVWQGKNSEFSVFDFEQVRQATNNFSQDNKLGQGGFGAVYKGQFPAGRLEIAVKRLASHSSQGFVEFKNEVQLIAKLQHMNLVRLLGCCSQEEEKILVYEYLPNKSLDFFIFDKNKRALLDWSKLVAIIAGIADGLLYLHKHSRLRVIHRDLKPSNILLDKEMNPKISDFGLAKIFTSNNTEGNTTRRVVGTYGYMAPEYASEGVFSIKSDVFSFGVVIFEILIGKRNSGIQQYGHFINLLGNAWQLWKEGRWIDIIDPALVPKSHSTEMMRCINIALLCVQDNAVDRPTMEDVIAMLSSETMVIPEPKQPAYFNVRVGNEEASAGTESCSINDMTISVTIPR